MILLYYGIMIAGALAMVIIFFLHQSFLPLERAVLILPWAEVEKDRRANTGEVTMAGETMCVRYESGEEHEFRAEGLRVSPEGAALVRLGDRPLLIVLDRGRGRKAYVVDTARAAAKGDFDAGILGWWKHGTGTCVAAAGAHVIEVHRCYGRDRIYWIDPLRAMAGNAFGMGIERTLIAPTRNVDGVEYVDRCICVARGARMWKVELT